jgi:hypothetical protein
MYSPQEIAAMTASEQEMARSMNAAEEAGNDPFGDEAPDAEEADEIPGDNTEAEEKPAEEEAPADDKPADDKPAEEAPAAAAEEPPAEGGEETPEIDVPPAPVLVGQAPADFDAKVNTLRDAIDEARVRWEAGEIDLKDLAKIERPLQDQIAGLQREAAVAEAMNKANEQFARNQALAVIEQVRTTAKAQGIDYGTADKPTEHAHSFDRQLQVLALDPTWRGKSFAAQAREAHRVVALLNGKTAAAPAPAPPPAAARAKPPAPPVTLRDLPAAERANAGGDLEAQWAAATGAAAEKLWSRMTPAQQQRAMGE